MVYLGLKPAQKVTKATNINNIHMQDIIDTAVAAGNFKTLATALTVAGWIEPLKEAGPFTVFAPTDEAFAKIPEETLKAVLADKAKLESILKYHVVAGKVMAADVMGMTSGKTLQGTDVAVKVDGDKVWINNAEVVKADIECTNGVIHVIDTVLMPS
jgi:uncharacterized surface protein with fasciclin (FAS1) repeats